MGFRVWIDGINRDSTVATTSASGFTLQRGQAILQAQAIIKGEVVSGSFRGADNVRVVRPDIIFDHALFQNVRYQDFDSLGNTFLSYNTDPLATVPPIDPTLIPRDGPLAVPSANQNSSVRIFGEDIDLRDSRLFGQLFFTDSAGTSALTTTGSTLPPVTPDNSFAPKLRFDYPSSAFGVSDTITQTRSGYLPPGDYPIVRVPTGGVIQLERGETYSFREFHMSQATLELVGSSSLPCLIYVNYFTSILGGRANIPTTGAPTPWNLQIFGVGGDSRFYGNGAGFTKQFLWIYHYRPLLRFRWSFRTHFAKRYSI